MHWIIGFILRNRNASSLVLTVALSVWMIASPHSHQLTITRTLIFSVFYPVQLTLNTLTRITSIFRENQTLREQLAALTTRLVLLEEAGRENERLRYLLGFSDESHYNLVPVRIIAREPSDQYRSVIINAGSTSGIGRFMPLVDSYGLAGRTLMVLGTISQVQLLRDPANRASVLLTRSRVAGILETKNGEHFTVRYRAYVDAVAGDTVITSGLGGVYPKGILVGTVTGFEPDDDPLFKRAQIQTSVDFGTLEEAFVMRMSPQWQAFRAEAGSIEFPQ